MSSKSRIYFTETTGTQTDLARCSAVPMVMVPFDQYEAMARVYYGRSTPTASVINSLPLSETTVGGIPSII